MSLDESPKHVANIAAAVVPAASYLSGISELVTIMAGLVSFVWFSVSLWKLFFPVNFAKFVRRINGEKNDA